MFEKIMKFILDKIPQKQTIIPQFSGLMPIANIINKLPTHPTKTWGRRTLDRIDTLIVHQAATKATGSNNYIESIARYHTTPTSDRNKNGKIDAWERNHLSAEGAPGICYHFVISRSGKIFQCNKLSNVTWHAKGWNTRSIGVLICGDFAGPTWEGSELPTPAQVRNLKRLLASLQKKYNIEIENVKGHCEVDPNHKPSCPGNILLEVIKTYRNNHA